MKMASRPPPVSVLCSFLFPFSVTRLLLVRSYWALVSLMDMMWVSVPVKKSRTPETAAACSKKKKTLPNLAGTAMPASANNLPKTLQFNVRIFLISWAAQRSAV